MDINECTIEQLEERIKELKQQKVEEQIKIMNEINKLLEKLSKTGAKIVSYDSDGIESSIDSFVYDNYDGAFVIKIKDYY